MSLPSGSSRLAFLGPRVIRFIPKIRGLHCEQQPLRWRSAWKRTHFMWPSQGWRSWKAEAWRKLGLLHINDALASITLFLISAASKGKSNISESYSHMLTYYQVKLSDGPRNYNHLQGMHAVQQTPSYKLSDECYLFLSEKESKIGS